MRDFVSAIDAQIAATEKKPVHLYELALTNVTLRWAASKTDLVFPTGGNTFFAKGVTHEDITSSISGGTGRARVQFSDGSGEIRGYHFADDFKGKIITAYRVYRDAVGSADNAVRLFSGPIISPSWDYQTFRVEIMAGGSLRQTLPKRGYTTRCPWKPGGAECNADGLLDNTQAPFYYASEVTGSGSSWTDVARTEADDYWTHAMILIQPDTYTVYRRYVTAFSAGEFTLDFPVPISVESTVNYEIFRGCDGSWSACNGDEAWGPSADNHVNFGGFLKINEQEQMG